MKRIEPLIDQYGNLSRASFFADYIEILTAKGHRARKSLLRDLIVDSYEDKKDILLDPRAPTPEGWTPAEYADGAWKCLKQRSEILGEKYPFEVRDDRLVRRAPASIEQTPYIGLLCITLAHAFKADTYLKVEDVFEAVVAQSMRGLGLAVGEVGESFRSNGGDFETTLTTVGRQIGIPTYPNAASRRIAANDEKVDLVGHLSWGDIRQGRWLYICQVTCGASDSWEEKLNAPVPLKWMQFLGDILPPKPFLALPHHVEDGTVTYLKDIQRSIVDRLKIVNQLDALPPSVEPIIEHVFAADIQTWAIL